MNAVLRVVSSVLPGLGTMLIALAGAAGAAAGEANLIVNGDFEQPSATNPPPGWSMWGAPQYKTAEHFTRDTQQPHSGQACLRIYHPARSGGYIVSSPQTALRPQPGMMYTVTFWARADRPGDALFGWTAYRTIHPFDEAQAPPQAVLHVEPQWKEFRFVVHEGWDFFADETRYLMLVFNATSKRSEERTLWIDDVAVSEQPSTRAGRLVNPATLTYDRLEHRLKPGEKLMVAVDAQRHLAEAQREVGGVSFHRVAGYAGLPYDRQGRYVLSPALEEAIREMHLPMTRLYALGDEPFGLEAALDKTADLCRRIGVAPSRVPLEFERQGAETTLPPETWVRGVQHSLARGYGFCHWEITNEPYVDGARPTFPTADSYVEHFQAVGRAIRQAHPQARLGLAIAHRSPTWGNYVLKQAAGSYDFVAPHYYCGVDVERTPFEDVVLTANYRILDESLQVNALLRLYNPGRDVCQYDTEWGLFSRDAKHKEPDDIPRNANIFGMVHRAVRLIYYLREGMLRGASTWEMFSFRHTPGFGLFAKDASQLRSMTYWLYYYFNRHAGRWVLPIEGTAPYREGRMAGQTWRGPLTPIVATLSEDGRHVLLMVANGSWDRAIPAELELLHFAGRHVQGVVLSHADKDASPYIERKEELVRDLPIEQDGSRLKFTLPPHCVAFLDVEQ